jgi:hypothetical protein
VGKLTDEHTRSLRTRTLAAMAPPALA